ETLLLAMGLAGAGVIGAVLIRAAMAWRRVHEGGVDEADEFFLACWVVGMLTFNLCLFFASVRYIVPALVPTVLLLQRAFRDPLEPRARQSRSQLAAAISFTVGMLLSAADQQFAGIYRSYAASLPTAAQQRWFTGHWGLQHYLEEKGGRTLSSASPYEP